MSDIPKPKGEMAKAKKNPVKTIELTEWIRQDEPVGFLVCCPVSSILDYSIHDLISDAIDAANDCEEQTVGTPEEVGEGEWPIYPLYASHPLTKKQLEKLR